VDRCLLRYQSDTDTTCFRLLFAPSCGSNLEIAAEISFTYLFEEQAHPCSLFLCDLCYTARVPCDLIFKEPTMEWTTPQHEEIDLNCEISSYANAEL
jgi:hypothetical protein